MIFLLGGSGYVGHAYQTLLQSKGLAFKSIARADLDYTNPAKLAAALRTDRATFLINAAGYTGKPNVDACELEGRYKAVEDQGTMDYALGFFLSITMFQTLSEVIGSSAAAISLALLLSSLSVFLRDIQNAVGPLSMVLMYSSAVFYSANMIPPAIWTWLKYNPLSTSSNKSAPFCYGVNRCTGLVAAPAFS